MNKANIRKVALSAIVLFFASFVGCSEKTQNNEPELVAEGFTGVPSATATKMFHANILVTAGDENGEMINGARVYIKSLNNSCSFVGSATIKDGNPIKIECLESSDVALGATAPLWTKEGGKVKVGEIIQSTTLLTNSINRTVVIPLQPTNIELTMEVVWTGATVPTQTEERMFDLNLTKAQVERVSGAYVDMYWQNANLSYGDFYAGLAQNNVLIGAGSDAQQLPNSGEAYEKYAGSVNQTENPSSLQAVALTNKLYIGSVKIWFKAELELEGKAPEEILELFPHTH